MQYITAMEFQVINDMPLQGRLYPRYIEWIENVSFRVSFKNRRLDKFFVDIADFKIFCRNIWHLIA